MVGTHSSCRPRAFTTLIQNSFNARVLYNGINVYILVTYSIGMQYARFVTFVRHVIANVFFKFNSNTNNGIEMMYYDEWHLCSTLGHKKESSCFASRQKLIVVNPFLIILHFYKHLKADLPICATKNSMAIEQPWGLPLTISHVLIYLVCRPTHQSYQ